MSSELLISFGVVDFPLARIRDEVGRFLMSNNAGRAYTEMQVGLAAAELSRAVRDEFIKGTDKNGRSHNKTGETLNTLQIHVAGLVADVTMGKGAPYVEYGWARPAMSKPGGVFVFVDSEGTTVFTRTVKAVTYKGDKFVERAMMRVDLRKMLDQIAYGTFSDITGYAVDRSGFRYTGGQQFRPLPQFFKGH